MLIRRGKKGLLTFKQRVPVRFKRIEQRSFVYIALKTDSEAEAEAKLPGMIDAQIAVWEAKLGGHDPEARVLEARLKDIATARGFIYRPASELADGSLSEILSRLQAVESASIRDAAVVGDALMGAVEFSGVVISELFERYSELTEDRRRGYSPDQTRRWSNARRKAVANWIKSVGDMPVRDISRAHVLKFRAWWWSRIAAGQTKAGTANKDFSHLGAMIAALYQLEGTDAPNPFHGVRFEDDTDTGVPFSRSWISEKILAPDALIGLNPDAKGILLAFINTGARPSELVDLTAKNIILDHNIPHIAIAPDGGRRLKTRHSARKIPLVGVSLEAFRRHATGFERYRGGASKWSALVTGYMRRQGLLETEAHQPYSLRHTFSDSLQNTNCPDRTRRELMGHVVPGINYGAGASLETKLEWVEKIAF